MSGPSADYAQAIRDLADELVVQVDVHEAPPSQLVVPCIVIRPDNPWMVPSDPDQTFGSIAERYVAMCVVAAGDPISSKDQLRVLVRLARDAGDLRRWRWIETSGIGPVEDSGIDYLAATVNVTYSAED